MDADRVLRFATFGLVDGFMGHTWYKNLDIVVENVLGEDGFVTIASKVRALALATGLRLHPSTGY